VTSRRGVFLLALGVVVAAPALARAEDEEDGAYGRLDGDFMLHLGAGAALAAGGPALTLETGALYLSTAGAYFRYADALGSDGARVRRALASGLELRPLFLARYAKNNEAGPAHLDLFVDSLTFQVGAWWDSDRRAPDPGLARTPGLEIGLGLDVPILARASGPYVGMRGVLRWRAADLDGAGKDDVVDRGALLSLMLAWHHVFYTHLVDAGDRVLR